MDLTTVFLIGTTGGVAALLVSLYLDGRELRRRVDYLEHVIRSAARGEVDLRMVNGEVLANATRIYN